MIWGKIAKMKLRAEDLTKMMGEGMQIVDVKVSVCSRLLCISMSHRASRAQRT